MKNVHNCLLDVRFDKVDPKRHRIRFANSEVVDGKVEIMACATVLAIYAYDLFPCSRLSNICDCIVELHVTDDTIWSEHWPIAMYEQAMYKVSKFSKRD